MTKDTLYEARTINAAGLVQKTGGLTISDLEAIRHELAKFNYIDFDEASHSYTFNGTQLLSVTTLLQQFKNPFDHEYWAQIKAKERKVLPETVLAEWQAKAEHAQLRGTVLHRYMEDKLSNQSNQELVKPAIGELDEGLKVIADQFLGDIQGKMTPVQSEFKVGSLDFAIAGTVDQLFYNHKSQQLEIWDWKTNAKIASESRYTLKNSMQHLADCELTIYSLQLQMYRQLIMRNSQLQIGNCYLAWFNPANTSYRIFKALNLQVEVATIFNERAITL